MAYKGGAAHHFGHPLPADAPSRTKFWIDKTPTAVPVAADDATPSDDVAFGMSRFWVVLDAVAVVDVSRFHMCACAW